MEGLTPEQRELLQRKWEAAQSAKNRPDFVLPIQEGKRDVRRPLFCCHPPLGVTGYYLNIARHLHPDQPVYGVDCPAFHEVRDPFDDIVEMAAYYNDAIRAIQPHGPYLLIGHSSASYIAYEMALQLIESGNEVPLLILLDSAAPYGPLSPIMDAFKVSGDALYESIEALFISVWCVSLGYNKPLTFTMDDLIPLSLAERYELAEQYLKGAGFLPQNATADMVRTVLRMIAYHARADASYHEKHTPDGSERRFEHRAVLLRCTEVTHWPGYDFSSQPDTSEFSNWDKFCSGPIDVIDIPHADHVSIVIEPAVKAVAEAMSPYLDQYATLQ